MQCADVKACDSGYLRMKSDGAFVFANRSIELR